MCPKGQYPRKPYRRKTDPVTRKKELWIQEHSHHSRGSLLPVARYEFSATEWASKLGRRYIELENTLGVGWLTIISTTLAQERINALEKLKSPKIYERVIGIIKQEKTGDRRKTANEIC